MLSEHPKAYGVLSIFFDCFAVDWGGCTFGYFARAS
jgi:hypothetical protein